MPDGRADVRDHVGVRQHDTLGPAGGGRGVQDGRHVLAVPLDRAAGRTGGQPLQGLYYPPTLFVDVPPDAEILRREVFGPVLTLQTFTDEAEAIALANSTDYGLAATVYTGSQTRSERVSAAVTSEGSAQPAAKCESTAARSIPTIASRPSSSAARAIPRASACKRSVKIST